eukprot:scaffold50_cov420-Prasinococcus_capsulatus_cf.AAC.27
MNQAREVELPSTVGLGNVVRHQVREARHGNRELPRVHPLAAFVPVPASTKDVLRCHIEGVHFAVQRGPDGGLDVHQRV